MTKTALIIVDVQNDFLPPDGSLAVPDGDQVIPVVQDLLNGNWEWDLVVASQVIWLFFTAGRRADVRTTTHKGTSRSLRLILPMRLRRNI
jgi:nicotinamidase-related amidase